jgi:hypothetical protein
MFGSDSLSHQFNVARYSAIKNPPGILIYTNAYQFILSIGKKHVSTMLTTRMLLHIGSHSFTPMIVAILLYNSNVFYSSPTLVHAGHLVSYTFPNDAAGCCLCCLRVSCLSMLLEMLSQPHIQHQNNGHVEGQRFHLHS